MVKVIIGFLCGFGCCSLLHAWHIKEHEGARKLELPVSHDDWVDEYRIAFYTIGLATVYLLYNWSTVDKATVFISVVSVLLLWYSLKD